MATDIIASVVTGGSNNHSTTSEEANAYATDWVTPGVVGTITSTSGVAPSTGSFAVNAQGTPAMAVDVSAGQVYIQATPTSQASQVLRGKMSAAYTSYTISANSSGSTKYDWIYVQVSASTAANPAASANDVITLVTSRSSSNTSDNGTPPTYGQLLAVVTVSNGASSITNANISDRRTQAVLSIAQTSTVTGWNTLSGSITAVTYNGNRSYTLTTSADNTSIVSPGMRLRTTRTVVAPTQCASLNGSNNYFSKSSPSAMTFTNNFVVSAWVKMNAYSTSYQQIVSRYNGTQGWNLQISPSGQVSLQGMNASSANYSYVQSYQSIPLNKWVHITAQLDMSTFTATTTTSYVMFDGVDVPASVARGGTNPTALVQAGNLEIGSWNGGLLPFNGKIAQVAIYSAKVTQATIRATISQGLAGTETSLISAYSFNNSLNDLNTNANNLTNNNSASITNADSPFGYQAGGSISSTLDYGIVQAITSTTIIVQVPEGGTIPTSGGVSAVSYANVKSPYGFPLQVDKWCVELINRSQLDNKAGATASTWYNVLNITFPIGAWRVSNSHSLDVQHAGVTFLNMYFTLSTSNNSESDTRFTSRTPFVSSSSTEVSAQIYNSATLNLSAQTVYYLNASTDRSSTTHLYFQGFTPYGDGVTRAENAYL